MFYKENRYCYYQKRKYKHYDEMIKNLEDAIKLCDHMIEQEKKNGDNKRNKAEGGIE